MKGRYWAPFSAVVLAAASSACCWLPLVAVGLGLGAGGAAMALERYRWYLLGAAAVLIGAGFYWSERRDPACAPDGSCPPRDARLRWVHRGVLWICTALVVLFALFPQFTGAFGLGSGPGVGRIEQDSQAFARSTDLASAMSGSDRLVRLSAGANELRDAFNHDLGSVRIIALLSPT